MDKRVSQLMLEALNRLPALPFWSSMVAENLYSASCESFLQSSLLWALNASNSELIADRERLLSGSGNRGTKPDLLLFKRRQRQAWLDATNRLDRLRIGCGFVYVKLAWSKGDAYGSATIPAKANALLSDIDQLRGLNELAAGSGLNDTKALLIVSGCGSVKGNPDESTTASSECEAELIDRIQLGLKAKKFGFTRNLGSVWLAKGEKVLSASDRFASLLASVLDVSVAKKSRRGIS